MAAKERTADDGIPIIRIDDEGIVDLASLLEDDSAASEIPPSPSADEVADAAAEAKSALSAAEMLIAEMTQADAEPPAPKAEAPPEPKQATASNVFQVDLDGLDDFEALLQRTMGEAAGLGAPAEGVPTLQDDGLAAASSPQAALEDPSPQKLIRTTKWLKPERAQEREREREREKEPRDVATQDSKAIDELRKKVKDMNAETERYRTRLSGEAKEARGKGREDAFKVLMPIMDTLEMALKSVEETPDIDQFTQGITMVVKQLATDLAQLGLETVDPAGEPFDPNLHEAFQQVDTGKVEPGHVAEVVRKGYRFEQRLLRAAQVLVEKTDKG